MDRKAVLITGAARGLGACFAQTLAADYDIIITDREPQEKAEDTIRQCKAKGAEVLFIQSDVASYASCEDAVGKATVKFGGIYGLVNNAGITRDALLMRMTEEQFDQVIAINLKSVFNMSRLVVPYMTKARSGRIVNISSVAGVYGNAGQTNYAASKAGMIGFTKSLAKEIGSRGITVNAIAPGFIETDMTASLPADYIEASKSRIALRALGKTQDVANAVEFLISDKSAYVTGHVLLVDGGMSL